MADPLTALGLASNIVQLITFASSLVSKTREISKSANGALVENLELEAIASNLQELSRGIRGLRSRQESYVRSTKGTAAERHLEELCEGCEMVSGQLLVVIRGLRSDARHVSWSSFRQALLSVWKEKRIDALVERLERYRCQIDTALLASLREYIQEKDGKSADSLTDYMQKLAKKEKDSMSLGEYMRMLDGMDPKSLELKLQKEKSLFSSKVSENAICAREDRARSQILKQLHFNSMEARFQRILKAYDRTFDWIFHDKNCQEDFVQWLQSDETLYWITGKPGSGKSTLMKYLSVHPKTTSLLKRWSRETPMITAWFFFWNSGTDMQMSEMGLLQTLLYQASSQHKAVISRIFPDRWRYYGLFGSNSHPWTLPELFQAFENLVSDNSRKFFFLIDGIDEFEGDEGNLAKFLLGIASSRQNVKLCVASRPWLVFEEAFQFRPSLCLENLTAPDIRHFVSRNMHDNLMFSQLQKVKPAEADGLILEVTGKACGVFLWVHLVVESLLEGLRDGDSITDLQERLWVLPSDLEDLFAKIICRLSPPYMKQACMVFQITRAAEEPVSLLFLSYTLDGFDKAVGAKVKAITPDEMDYRAESMRRRLNSRCKGLLEAPDFELEGPDAKVQYLHRTVKDFLSKRRAWEDSPFTDQATFDPDLQLCAAFILYMKGLDQRKGTFLDKFWAAFSDCVRYSARFKESVADSHLTVLNQLNRVGHELYDSTNPDDPDGGTWLNTIIANGRSTNLFVVERITSWYQTGPIEDTLFPIYAIEYQIQEYIKCTLESDRKLDLREAGQSLLSKAVLLKDSETVKLLLQQGVSPNCRTVEGTLWQDVLCEASDPANSSGTKEEWADIIEAFLEHDANPAIAIQQQSVESIIRSTFQQWDRDRTSKMIEVVSRSRKKNKKSKWASSSLKGFFGRSGTGFGSREK
ncbi:hypothetical protein BGZ57DRAFT_972296 [Hyaloscypha finlandica]|nr:hypothetical protein BGZ57DRAFT_972296 [Hyaloscypha finlandica]